MTRLLRLVAPALLVAALPAAPPLAQTASLEDVGPRLRGIAAPNTTVAGGEEPAGLQINPAAPGFVAGPSLQYFHEARTRGSWLGDAAFLTLPLGGLVPTLALDWIRPGDAPRFRRTTLGLALSDHRSFSVGGAWTWVHSPDRDLDRVDSYSLGVTLRPARWLSLAASGDGLGARLAGQRLPVRWDVGAAVRGWNDRLTFSTDLLASDRATGAGDFDPRALAFGVAGELVGGLAASAQIQAPLRAGGVTVGVLALTWNGAHAGVTAAGALDRGRGVRWLAGARFSSEAYRSSPPGPARSTHVDLPAELSRSGGFLFPAPRDLHARLIARLRELREDPSVGGVAVTVDELPGGLARAGELRAALADLAARKPVVAYLRGGRLSAYWIASAATKIYAPPAAWVDVTGLSSTTPFLREGLARIGVAFDVVAAGRYKNAPDPLVRQSMSDPHREAQDLLLDGLFGRILADVAAARRLPEPRVRELVDRGMFTSVEAQAAGLVDGVAWPDELDDLVSTGAGRKLAPGAPSRGEPREAQRWGARPVIAVIPIEGAIVAGRSRGAPVGGRVAGAESIGREIRRAVEDPRVKAIVLRIDSPGGDALASDLLWREVMRARRRGKPVVASLGDIAASGGYLVAVGAEAIVAEPSSVTGSIGVFALKPDLSGLLGKLGVNVVTLRRGVHADLLSAARPWTPDERALLERHVEAFYAGFKSRVAEGRQMSPEEVERSAAGRAWTGAQAKERRLVDRLGSLDDAIALARERAGVAAGDEEVRRFEPPRRPFESLARLAGAERPDLLARLAEAVPEVSTGLLLLEMGEIVALPVEWLTHPPAPAP